MKQRGRAGCLLVMSVLVMSACSQQVVSRQSVGETPPRGTVSEASAEAGDCSVTLLLVPTCGAWFGVSSPSSDGRYDYVQGLREYDDLIGVPPDILHFYQRGAESFPTFEQISLAEVPGRPRALLYFNWKPSLELTWRQIADGEADDAIAVVAQSLRAYEHRVFLTVFHEPEDNVVDDPSSGMTTEDYVSMYRHVVSALRAQGVDNAVFVMGYMGFQRWSSIVDDLYPGDDVVDWIAYDPYGFDSHASFADVLDSTTSPDWPGFYSWATNRAPDKPIMLAEWGFDLREAATASRLIADAATILEQSFPRIKALVYWNDRGERVDARLSQASTTTPEFIEAFKDLAAHPYFDASPSQLAP